MTRDLGGPPSGAAARSRYHAAVALLTVVLLIGCAAPTPPRIKTVPLGIPPARALLLNATDLPAAYNETDTSASTGDRAGLVETATAHFVRNASDEDRADVSSLAVVCETPADAHAFLAEALANAQPAERSTNLTWGDESLLVHNGNVDLLYLRAGPVLWFTSASQNRARDVEVVDLAPRLLAKLHPGA